MGFFSGISKAVKGVVGGVKDAFSGGGAGKFLGGVLDSFTGGFGSTLLNAGTSLLGGRMAQRGQEDTNFANAQMAQKQMDFQERMSSTGYQRAVKDMQRAGLNPMLAYSQGPASSPAGSSAVMMNEKGAGIAAAAQVMQQMSSAAQIGQIKAQTANINADTVNKQLQPELIAGQVRQTLASSGQLEAATKRTQQDIEQFERTWEEMARKLRGEAKSAMYGGESASRRYNIESATEAEEVQRIRSEVERLKLMTQITGLQVPAAVNEAEFELSKLGEYSRSTKFLVDTGQDITGIIGNIGRGLPRKGSSLSRTFRDPKTGGTTTSREYRYE